MWIYAATEGLNPSLVSAVAVFVGSATGVLGTVSLHVGSRRTQKSSDAKLLIDSLMSDNKALRDANREAEARADKWRQAFDDVAALRRSEFEAAVARFFPEEFQKYGKSD